MVSFRAAPRAWMRLAPHVSLLLLAGALAVPENQRGEVVEIGDRRQAIRSAVGRAKPGDIVVIAGKGHEKYQVIGAQVLPFDDVAVAREALGRRGVWNRSS